MGAAATPQTITLSFMDHRLGLCPWDTSLLGRGPRSSRPPCHEVLPADTSPHSNAGRRWTAGNGNVIGLSVCDHMVKAN